MSSGQVLHSFEDDASQLPSCGWGLDPVTVAPCTVMAVMPLMAGSARELLAECHQDRVSVSEALLRTMIWDLLEAVQHLLEHRIVHR